MVDDGFNPSSLNNAVAVGRVFLVKSINMLLIWLHTAVGVCATRTMALNILEAGIEEGVSTL